MSEQVILTNMCLIRNPENQVVVQDRRDKNWSGITFPGGKIEYAESFKKAVIREVYEETGLVISDPVLVGTKQFQTDKDERYIVLLYIATQFTGTLRSSEEGEVFWLDVSELQNYKLAPDLMDMYKVMISDELSEFYYVRNQNEESDWELQLL
ncbi:8-oxo-dGTP diphosphatase [Alkalibacterium sp. s-m-22]|uniref:8-oxo-dGTP diphosphatase n=1 Tax=Alkalibacterium pelagium TaxID=426702 RepID=A0A1H7FZ25_9LACT|nr:8-oxo-dGTP diphosphatase [Alkalibacterium pelagium]GEN49953.1 7,8-dihydro-8-oxoguanine triphosphatase [Alkalibacterium pelagium]SEK31306.1 8-oxo-dGTP diphosphatase [Alkalibacterium pelagium]